MKGLQEAIEACNKEYSAKNCVAYTVLKDNGEFEHTHEFACYGGIGRHLTDSVAIVNQIQKNYLGYFKSLPANTAERFINWVVNESVYKDVFLEHDVDKIIKENAWAVRTDLPGRVVVSAMTVMRALTEGNRGCLSALHFNKLTDAGISPEFAFILGHYLDTNMSSISAGYDSHHCALSKDYMVIDEAVNFCLKRFTNPGLGPFREKRTYEGVHQLFREEISDKFYSWLKTEYKKLPSSQVSIMKSDPFSHYGSTEQLGCGKGIVEDLVTIYNKFKEQFLTEKDTADE